MAPLCYSAKFAIWQPSLIQDQEEMEENGPMVILVSPSSSSSESARCAIEFGAALPSAPPAAVTSADREGGGSHLLKIADFKVCH